MQRRKPDERAYDVPTDDIHGLCEGGVRISEHQHAGSAKGAQQQEYVQTSAEERKCANGYEPTEPTQQDGTGTQTRWALTARATTALNKVKHHGVGECALARIGACESQATRSVRGP